MNQIDNVSFSFNASDLLDVCPNPAFINPVFIQSSAPMPDPNEMPQLSLADRNACALIPYREPKRFAIEPVWFDPIFGMSEFLEKLGSLKKEQDVGLLMEVIQKNRHMQLSSFRIIDLLKGNYPKDGSKFSNRGLQILLDKFRPRLDAADLEDIIRLYGIEAVAPIIDLVSQLCVLSYIPSDLDLFLFLFENLNRDDFVRFFDVHRSYFVDHVSEINEYFGKPEPHFEFAKWLRDEGRLAIDLSIFISHFARNGEIELFQRIVKESKNFNLDKAFFKEEIQDCLAPYIPVDLSSFPFKPAAIGQNGCRAVVFTEEGEIHSLPGQMASELVKQAGHGSNWDSFQIYLHPGHASIAFKDGHFGFYPKEMGALGNQANLGALHALEAAMIEKKHEIAAESSITLGAKLGSQLGISAPSQKSQSKKVAQAPLKTRNLLGGNGLSQLCQIVDDSREADFSDKKKGLKLTVYAPKEKIETIRQYVTQTKKLCDSGSETYHLFTRNCIDFVQKAIEASGIQADFRDAFHTMQYLRRFSHANSFSLLRSSGPIIHEHPNTTLTFDAGIVDRIPRSLPKAAVAAAIAVPYCYFLQRALPAVKETVVRAAQRIYRVSQFAVLTAAAMGNLLFNPARIWRRV